jgi:dihydrofolate reductase
MGRVRGYLATSLDGFIATTDDAVAWLERPRESGLPLAVGEWAATEPRGLEFDDFLGDVGCIVMGRRTLEVVAGFGGPWAYGDIPMLVLSSHQLPDVPGTVRPVSGSIGDVIAEARALAGDKDVYVDGGLTVRSALDAGLLDHLVVTVLPTALGEGIPLFAGLTTPAEFSVEKVVRWGPGFVQLHLDTRNRDAGSAA